jgi:putative membrane protein
MESDDPRIRFAAERTLLAWIRTGLALMGFGFVVARFGLFLRELEVARPGGSTLPTGRSLWIGTALVLLGVGVTILGAVQHWRILWLLDRGQIYAPRWSLGIAVAIMLAVLGLGMVFYLIVVNQ